MNNEITITDNETPEIDDPNYGIDDPTDEQLASYYGYGDGGKSAEDQPYSEVK
jgi:hypothetical protein